MNGCLDTNIELKYIEAVPDGLQDLFPNLPKRKCVYCEKTIPSRKRIDAEYCSEDCRRLAFKKRKIDRIKNKQIRNYKKAKLFLMEHPFIYHEILNIIEKEIKDDQKYLSMQGIIYELRKAYHCHFPNVFTRPIKLIVIEKNPQYREYFRTVSR